MADAATFETIHVDERTVACDGGNTALGHPRGCRYSEEREGGVSYCSRRYVLNEGAGHGSGH